jgi:hypothetical protein
MKFSGADGYGVAASSPVLRQLFRLKAGDVKAQAIGLGRLSHERR